VRVALEQAGVRVESAELTMQAKALVPVEVAQARQNLRLIETLEDHDDVQRVTANFDLPDEILAEAATS
jgi:transcriptional/translational regulatory protein YebC/TACO1